MFPWYGILGVFIIIFSEFTMFLRVQPFVYWFTPTVWIGYILLVDATIYLIKGNSLLMNKRLKFLQMFLASLDFWFMFEIYNKLVPSSGWHYLNLPQSRLVTLTMGSIAFATIIPAVFETYDLVRLFHIFDKIKMRIKIPTNRLFINMLIVVGIIFILVPFIVTTPWLWAFVWTGFILLIDPILYLFHDEKSLIMLVKKRNFKIILSLMLAGYICGFFWEFWNYWAYTKWYYTVPILQNIKVFEIPVVGFLAYGPFALELYVMYNFVRLLLSKRIWGIGNF